MAFDSIIEIKRNEGLFMKLSTRSRYGLRAIIELAEHGELTKVSLNNIAKQQEISLRYLEQLFSELKKEGYVSSTRGAHGGYSLAKKPSEISAGEIIRTLEGTMLPVHCVDEKSPNKCKRSEDCKTREVWELIHNRINETIDSIKLSDLLDK